MQILNCAQCGAEFEAELPPGTEGVICPRCGAVTAVAPAAQGQVIDVQARPVGDDTQAEEVRVEEHQGKGYYRRTVSGPGGAYRFEMARNIQGGQGCFTCGCVVVAVALFLMIRGCASLFGV